MNLTVALTYDLKDDYLAQELAPEACAEFDSVETIDDIENFLKSLGYRTERVGHVRALVQALAAGKRWDCVFNIAEGLHGRGREAQVPALLDAYDIPYVFSDTVVLALTLDKALTKRVVRDAGLRTAAFWNVEVGHAFDDRNPAFPLFVKPNADGTGKGITARSLVKTRAELDAAIAIIHSQFQQPALVEHYLSGREFTVGITGTSAEAGVIAVMEILLNARADECGYTYENKYHYEDRVEYRLVDDAEAQQAGELALAAWRLLGCRDGGRVDIRSDENAQPHFLEVNPLAGLHPVLGDLVILSGLAGVSYHDLLSRIMRSALSDSVRFPHQPQVTYA